MLKSTLGLLAWVGVMGGGATYVSSRKHLLNMLLSLEFISLSLFLLLMISTLTHTLSFTGMFFLVLVVCEGALGLSLLVSLIRSHGNDLISSPLLI